MSTAAELFGNAARAIFERLGESAVYTYVDGGAPSFISAIRAERIKEQVEGYGAAVAESTETISMLIDELLRAPKKLDTITLSESGLVYTVQYVLYNDGHVVKVAVV